MATFFTGVFAVDFFAIRKPSPYRDRHPRAISDLLNGFPDLPACGTSETTTDRHTPVNQDPLGRKTELRPNFHDSGLVQLAKITVKLPTPTLRNPRQLPQNNSPQPDAATIQTRRPCQSGIGPAKSKKVILAPSLDESLIPITCHSGTSTGQKNHE